MEQELTVLIYFASDNPLAPLVVSELKAIKDAGFQENTTVLVLYDPMEKGAETQLLDVNFKRRKAKGTFIGDGADPYVRNFIEDQVEDNDLKKGGPAAAVTAFESLERFIKFGLEKRTAKNYMLILLGHGMIVGNDTFLPDDDTDSAITLKQLKDLCDLFTSDNTTNLRLLGLHSCSMSSIEVAYELKGKADYMLATQGTMFVNGWPYRQLLKKTLNQVKRFKQGRDPELEYHKLIEKLYYLCLFNFTDFMTAGYSCDIALCHLDVQNFERLKKPLQDLVSALKQGLPRGPSIIKDLILLAHWDAQSFWSENYTDLWDFCACLAKRCNDAMTFLKENKVPPELLEVWKEELDKISTRCEAVQNVLAAPDGIVRLADNFGTEYQYARGLSIYFPWSRPLDDQRATVNSERPFNEQTERQATPTTVLDNYKKYDFTEDLGDHNWFSFLEAYWDGTKRESRDAPPQDRFRDNAEAGKAFDDAERMFEAGVRKRAAELKKTPDVGSDCTCPTIKNYPRSLRGPDRNLRQFSITPGVLKAFIPVKEGERPEPDEQ
jgi:hypothetical protein